MVLFVFVFLLVLLFLLVGAFSLVFGVCLCFPCGMTSYDLTPRVEAVTASASLAVIKTASKHLHNDLARAIEALEQKKILHPTPAGSFRMPEHQCHFTIFPKAPRLLWRSWKNVLEA